MEDTQWDLRPEGRAWGPEGLSRYYMAPEKIELIEGKLFRKNSGRLCWPFCWKTWASTKPCAWEGQTSGEPLWQTCLLPDRLCGPPLMFGSIYRTYSGNESTSTNYRRCDKPPLPPGEDQGEGVQLDSKEQRRQSDLGLVRLELVCHSPS